MEVNRMEKVLTERKGKVFTVTINRPDERNAVDRETAQLLADAFREFEADDDLHAAVLYGTGGNFCAGADLKALSFVGGNSLDRDMEKDGPMGITRMMLSKPVIAAISGYAVAGGLELAVWCDLRVAERDTVFGVFCRRFGVPLIDGGTQRLPRLIGMSRAMDMILTGRPVDAEEAYMMGLANRVVESGASKQEAQKLAAEIAEFPQTCMRSDRKSAYSGFEQEFNRAMEMEFSMGMDVIRSGETLEGAVRFTEGKGRHGQF